MYHEISHTWKQEIKGDRRLWVVVVGNWRLSPKSPFWDLWSNLVSHQFWWRILPSGKVDNDAKKYSVWFLDNTICSLRTSWRCVYNKYCSDNLAIAIKNEIERISYGWEGSEPLPAPPLPLYFDEVVSQYTYHNSIGEIGSLSSIVIMKMTTTCSIAIGHYWL